jgi:hypothetical protein
VGVMDIQLASIWVATGVLLGFQVSFIRWRIEREVHVGGRGDLTWLPLADWVNLISMIVAAVGTFILPILKLVDINFAINAFAVALILFIGYPFALAGHYDMFNPNTKRSFKRYTFQEIIAIVIILILAIAYIAFAAIRGNQ